MSGEIKWVKIEDLIHEYSKEHIKDWEKIDINNNVYFYHKGLEDETGFYFYCLTILTWNEKKPIHGECMFQGVGFDMVKHIYFGAHQTHNYGYLYYPNLYSLTEALELLKHLEIKYCWGDKIE